MPAEPLVHGLKVKAKENSSCCGEERGSQRRGADSGEGGQGPLLQAVLSGRAPPAPVPFSVTPTGRAARAASVARGLARPDLFGKQAGDVGGTARRWTR